jgi:hypothetical protein
MQNNKDIARENNIKDVSQPQTQLTAKECESIVQACVPLASELGLEKSKTCEEQLRATLESISDGFLHATVSGDLSM